MNEPISHHEYGPSKLENYDEQEEGCAAFMADPSTSEKAESGTLKHMATSSRDLSILGGDAEAEKEVQLVIDFMEGFREAFPVVYSELTLKTEKIFGTLDHLGLNEKRTQGIIIDAKFGAWSVTPAKRNLQGWAYVLLAFYNFPTLKRIKVIFYAAKTGLHTEHTFWRYRLPGLEKRIYKIIDRASQVKEAPMPGDYHPNAINCSYCLRLNCPARLALLGNLVTQWTGKPVQLPHLNLLEVTTPQLASLKRLSNVFKKFSSAVDDESKRRAFAGDIIDGYEIAEKSGARTVAGAINITQANKVIVSEWSDLEFANFNWGDYFLANVELSIADLEKEIARQAPPRSKAAATKIIIQALESAGLINASQVFFLRAIKE